MNKNADFIGKRVENTSEIEEKENETWWLFLQSDMGDV